MLPSPGWLATSPGNGEWAEATCHGLPTRCGLQMLSSVQTHVLTATQTSALWWCVASSSHCGFASPRSLWLKTVTVTTLLCPELGRDFRWFSQEWQQRADCFGMQTSHLSLSTHGESKAYRELKRVVDVGRSQTGRGGRGTILHSQHQNLCRRT